MRIDEYLVDITEMNSIIKPCLVPFAFTYHYAPPVDGVHSTAVYAADPLACAPNYSSRPDHKPCMAVAALRTDPFCSAEIVAGVNIHSYTEQPQLTLHSDAMKYGLGL